MTRVVVSPGWSVYVESLGKQVSGGTEVEVDAATAAHWCERGWAHLPVKVAAPAAKARPNRRD